MGFSKTAGIFTLCLILVLLSSCSDVYYAPSAQNVPLHKEKGELKFSGGPTLTEETEGWNLRSSYSFTDHIAAIASYNSFEDDAETAIGSGSTWRGGLGYYTPIHQTKWVFETYAGLGGGEGYLNRANTGYVDYQASELFMQQAFGYSGDFTFVGFSVKTSRMRYHDVKYTPNESIYRLDENPIHVFIEPALTLRLGYTFGYVETQFVRSYNISGTGLPMDEASVQLGFHLNLGPVINHFKEIHKKVPKP